MQKTEQMIEKIVTAVVGPTPSPKQEYYLRESLHHLVRLAQLERIVEAKRCVALAVGMPEEIAARRRSKVATRKLLTRLCSRQGRLNFESSDVSIGR